MVLLDLTVACYLIELSYKQRDYFPGSIATAAASPDKGATAG